MQFNYKTDPADMTDTDWPTKNIYIYIYICEKKKSKGAMAKYQDYQNLGHVHADHENPWSRQDTSGPRYFLLEYQGQIHKQRQKPGALLSSASYKENSLPTPIYSISNIATTPEWKAFNSWAITMTHPLYGKTK